MLIDLHDKLINYYFFGSNFMIMRKLLVGTLQHWHLIPYKLNVYYCSLFRIIFSFIFWIDLSIHISLAVLPSTSRLFVHFLAQARNIWEIMMKFGTLTYIDLRTNAIYEWEYNFWHFLTQPVDTRISGRIYNTLDGSISSNHLLYHLSCRK